MPLRIGCLYRAHSVVTECLSMQKTYQYRCYGCERIYADAEAPYRCGSCGEPLSLESLGTPAKAHMDAFPVSLWHYFDLLPAMDRSRVVTLGEGATPLVDAARVAGRYGFGRLTLKNEAANPTGSFKDRQVAVGITHARELGARTVAVVSSGNVACATAAYAARSGLRSILLMHGHAASSKLAQAASYGAVCVRVDSPSAAATFELCVEACRRFGWYHLSTAGMYEPFNVEGAKTIAYEIYQQTGGELPDWIVAPVGGGGLLGGIWRGLLDLKRLRLIDRLPRLAGVQAAGCAPLTAAISKGLRFLDTLREPWPNPRTVAGGIADDILFDGHTVLPAIRSTRGTAIAVSDEEILDAELFLARSEGLLCEPSSATVIAALPHLPEAAQGAHICVVLTGSGIKDLEAVKPRIAPPCVVEASLDALESALGSQS